MSVCIAYVYVCACSKPTTNSKSNSFALREQNRVIERETCENGFYRGKVVSFGADLSGFHTIGKFLFVEAYAKEGERQRNRGIHSLSLSLCTEKYTGGTGGTCPSNKDFQKPIQ